jgi:hypothetical protein
MDAVKQWTICPVCGYDLGFQPWKGNSSSDEICPSCGIQFGYHDATPDGLEGRQRIYAEWRQRWIDKGMPWSSVGQLPLPSWNPAEQVKKIG